VRNYDGINKKWESSTGGGRSGHEDKNMTKKGSWK
jgi:hypothetical protein